MYNKMKYGAAVSSGTTALFLALKALGIKEGDEVIIPDFTMIACAWAVSYCGATPVFVDCKEDLTIDENLIESKINANTRAIMPVHIYGRRCNMDAIMEIARQYNLFVVEDMAEAHGIMPVGDVACYSFFGNKTITTGEGGMCLTNDKRLHWQIQHLKAMAFDKNHTFLHKKTGYNFRMTNVQAAIGLAQVERIGEILAKRKLIEEWYDKHMPEGIKRSPKRDILWMYDIQTDCKNTRLIDFLAENGVESRLFFKPMTIQPMYFQQEVDGFNAYEASNRGLYLPTYTDMTEEEVIHVCNILKQAIECKII